MNKIPLKKLAPPYPKPDRDASPVNKTAKHAGFSEQPVFLALHLRASPLDMACYES
jgi:hypothetical protein